MNVTFFKYQGAGNDFILIDNRSLFFPKNNLELIRDLCDRRFGIGADGLILLENSGNSDFSMVYFNSDGNESTMCGNGGRCIVAFANKIGIIKNEANFVAIDGVHFASIENNLVNLQMIDVKTINEFPSHSFLHTGSPHHINFVSNVDLIDVKSEGAKIRFGAPYFKEGSNVNFVEQINPNSFKVRTYERGVEDETLACGTGVTAAAIAAYQKGITTNSTIYIEVLGGKLEVSFKKEQETFKDVFLKGPAEFVFEGTITI